MEDHRPALVKWTTVCRPKNQGGLGFMDTFTKNKALLMTNLHKFYNSTKYNKYKPHFITIKIHTTKEEKKERTLRDHG